jgi:hypothetical protein
MRARKALTLGLALGFGGMLADDVAAQYEVANRPVVPRADAAVQGPKFTYMLFWKQQDANTQQFAQALESTAAKHSVRAKFAAVNVADQANRDVVAHYGVSRAPMPLAICVAENGAVTGVFPRRPNEATLERALVTQAMADVTKALQDKKIVVVHVKQSPEIVLPVGAADFTADPDFQARTTVIDIVLNDPAEARFVSDMKIRPEDVSGSMVVVMAPPAALVGKFTASATRDEIVTKLHAAGKCCNDPNCKHNQKTK